MCVWFSALLCSNFTVSIDRVRHNDRLEFLGDAVVEFLTRYMYYIAWAHSKASSVIVSQEHSHTL